MSKAGSKFCLVYYYVPEDKDDPEFPNAFGLNTAIEDVRIPDIRRHFPLEGEYIFRFKVKVANSNVWMDVKEDGKIPLFGGRIVVKATRVSWEPRGDRPRATANERPREEARSTSQATNANSANSRQQAPPVQQNQGNSFGFEDFNLLSSTTSYGSNQGNNSSSNTPSSNKNAAHDHHDLLDFGGASSHSNSYKVNQETSKKPDLMTFDNLF